MQTCQSTMQSCHGIAMEYPRDGISHYLCENNICHLLNAAYAPPILPFSASIWVRNSSWLPQAQEMKWLDVRISVRSEVLWGSPGSVSYWFRAFGATWNFELADGLELPAHDNGLVQQC